jgi:hypothetical protein
MEKSEQDAPSEQYAPFKRSTFMGAGRVREMRKYLVVMALMAIPLVAQAQAQTQSMEIIPFPGSQIASVAFTNAPTSGYTLGTPIETIAADPAGAAVINKDIPGLLTDPHYDIFKSMNLKLIASLSGGQMTDQTIAQTEADLAALPTPAPSGP